MKNKKNLIKIGAISFAIWCLSLSFSSAVTLHLTGLKDLKAVNKQELTNKIIQIHFADNWNNFGWFIYYGNIDEESTTEPGGQFQVGVNNDFYECKNQLKWFYYNAERWERLWPLDKTTEDSRGVDSNISWWIYTACALSWYDKKLEDCTTKNQDVEVCRAEVNASNEADGNGYFGSVSHTYSEKDMRLIMWVRYDPADIKTKDFIKINTGTTLFPSFKRLSNKYPVGFIYDYNGWVGLAWCHIEEGNLQDDTMSKLIEELNEKWIDGMFIESNDKPDEKVKYIWNESGINCSSVSTEDTLSKVVIEWIVWASDKWSDYDTIFTQMGNQSDQKMQYFTTANVDNDTLMNYARKKAEILCRWKWRNELHHIEDWKGKVVCIKDWDIDATESNQIKNEGKTLIVKGQGSSVTITPMTWADINTNKYYDIFIDGGNLIIEENNDNVASGTNEELFVFTKEWFMSGGSYSYSGFNEMLSGAGIYSEDGYKWDDIAVWAFIRWNFIVNGHVGGEGLKHKYFIYWKFSTLDWFKDLENVFSWRCKNQISNEDYKFFCPRIEWNPYANAALVIIDQNYPSTFYNN